MKNVIDIKKFPDELLSANLKDCKFDRKAGTMTIDGKTYSTTVGGNIRLDNLIREHGKGKETLMLGDIISKLSSNGQKELASRLIQLTPGKISHGKDSEGRADKFNEVVKVHDNGKAMMMVIKGEVTDKEAVTAWLDGLQKSGHVHTLLNRDDLLDALENLGIDVSKYES